MKRAIILLIIFTGIMAWSAGAILAEEDYNPIRPQLKLKFRYIVEHIEQKDRGWEMTIVKASFPDSVTYTWLRPQKDGKDWKGTRILLDLKTSRNFNPWYKKDESKATADTSPWISQQVLKELRERGRADNFREGGTGALNWAAVDLAVKDRIVFPVLLNGKPEALHAFKLNKGLTIWNNPNNPLILEYEPLGIPLFTSVVGWKLIEIQY